MMARLRSKASVPLSVTGCERRVCRGVSAGPTPHYVGRAIAALAADPDVARFSGRALATWELSEIYPFTDRDGSRPHWGRYFAEVVGSR